MNWLRGAVRIWRSGVVITFTPKKEGRPSSVREDEGGVLSVVPAHADDAVVQERVAEHGAYDKAEARRRAYHISPLTHEQRHKASALRLQQVVARLAEKPGFGRVEGLLAELLETTEGINDGEVLVEVGKLLFCHGAHCMDAVRRGRKPFYRIDLPPCAAAENLNPKTKP